MLTSKQRAYLRGLANGVPALYQIGKDGITDNLVSMIKDALEARELIKIHVLETAPDTPRNLCDQLAEKVGGEPVQAIGSKITIYKEASENPAIILP
ncbi:MAG: YhbY family RNA-binding protein [Clostridia bacterium]|nr:YhbY family RNA-binding protein [Clostridia bacterium]